MIRIIVAILMLAGVANARPSAPGLYDVYDVIAPDTLNVRGGPGSDFPDIGDLAANATHIEVTSLDESGKWGVIRWGEGQGWVSMRFLSERAPNPVVGQVIEAGMACTGTEPFWGMWFNKDGSVVYDSMNTGRDDYRLIWSGTAINTGYRPLGFIIENKNGQMAGTLTREYCSDGMSEQPFGYRVDLLINGFNEVGMISGCCALSWD